VTIVYSVLDQAPARFGAVPGAAIHESVALAQYADALGYHRFWLAEHHAIDSIEISAPEVVIAQVAALTPRIRVGSGGILLPNHRPIHVAEQFRTLEALHPGRIDLGIGRSEGSLDEATVLAFQRSGDLAHGGGYERQLDELLAFGGQVPLPADDPMASIDVTPVGVPLPPVFLLGSSVGSAGTAARRGLGYGFAVHTNPEGAAPALARYRSEFRPSALRERPHAILAVKIIVGETEEHAIALSASQRVALAHVRLGRPGRLRPDAEAVAHQWTAAEREAEKSQHPESDLIGDADQVRRRLEALVAATGADEVLVITNVYDAAERRASFGRLAAAVGLRVEPEPARALSPP
jgi:luciferase family oxidoreductase group 1